MQNNEKICTVKREGGGNYKEKSFSFLVYF